MKIEVHPNCVFPEDMTQEELDEIFENLKTMVENGTLEENSRPVTEEEYAELVELGYVSDEEVKLN